MRRSCVIYAARATCSSAFNVLPRDLRVCDKLDLQSFQTNPLSKPRIPLIYLYILYYVRKIRDFLP